MSNTTYTYLDGSEIRLGDRLLVNEEEEMIVMDYFLPDSEEAIRYAVPEGGVLVSAESGTSFLISFAALNEDPDFQLLGRS